MQDGTDPEALASDDEVGAPVEPREDEPWDEGCGTGELFESTGHDGVDRVLATLGDLEQRSVHEHVEVFEEAHAGLRRALDDVDRE